MKTTINIGEMDMDIGSLLKQFPLRTFSKTLLPRPAAQVDAVLLLEPEQTLEARYLYVGRAENLPPRGPEGVPAGNLILDRLPSKPWLDACNIAVLQSPEALLPVFNALHRQMVRRQQTVLQLNQMFSVLLTHEGMQDLIRRASELLGNPLLLMERGGGFLAFQDRLPQSGADTIHISRLRGELDRAAMAEEHIRLLNASGVTGRMSQTRACQLYFDEYLGCTAAIAPIIVGNVEVAWLHAVEFCRPFDEADLECLSILTKQLSQEMQKNNFFAGRSKNGRDYFLLELLETPHPSETVIRRRMEALHIKPMRQHRLAVLSFPAGCASEAGFGALESQLGQVLSGCMWTAFQERFVILFSYEDEADIPARTKAVLRRTAITNHMTVGISGGFSRLSDIQRGYRQALTAVRLGRKFPITYNTGRPVCEYYQYAFLDMLEKCGRDDDLLQYCAPMLLRLLDYDQKNGTDLMNTLFEYLENSRSIAQTTAALYIHKNTLLNRLGRIRAIMDCDLSNSWDRFLLSLSYRILIYRNIYRPNSVKQLWERWEDLQKETPADEAPPI